MTEQDKSVIDKTKNHEWKNEEVGVNNMNNGERELTRKQKGWIGLGVGLLILIVLNTFEIRNDIIIMYVAWTMFSASYDPVLILTVDVILIIVFWFARVKIGSAVEWIFKKV